MSTKLFPELLRTNSIGFSMLGAQVAQKTQGKLRSHKLSGDSAFLTIGLPPVNWDAHIAH
jgi:hypothetical protein